MSGISSVPSHGSYYVNYSPYAPTIPDDAVGTRGMSGQACYPEEEMPSIESNVSINSDQPALEDRERLPSVGQAALGGAFGFTSVACDCYGTNLIGDGGDADVVEAEGDGEPDEVAEEDFSYEDYVDEYYDEATDETGEEDHVEVADEADGEDYYEDYTEEEAAPSVCDHGPEPFDLTSPADGLVGVPYYSDSAIDISFPYPHDLDEAIGDVVTCYAEIDDDPSFATPIMREVPAPGVLAFTPASPAEYFTCATPYQVRVRCVDACGNITASTTSRTFETGPTVEWTRTYNSPTNGADIGNGIAVDNDGNVYVTGSVNSNGGLWVKKYYSDGSDAWMQIIGTIPGMLCGEGIVVDNFGSAYVVGGFWRDPLPLNMDIGIGRYSSVDGAQDWTINYDGPGTNIDYGYDIAVDNTGQIFATGSTITMDGEHPWTGFYDSTGSRLFSLLRSNYGKSYGIAIDNFNNVYETGMSWSGGWWADKFAASIIWNRDFPIGEETTRDIAVDSTGNTFVIGSVMVAGAGQDILVRKLDVDGNPIWRDVYNGPVDGDDRGMSIAVSSSGGIYVAGHESTLGRSRDVWTRRYDSDGNPICTVTYNGPINGADEGHGIALDNISDNVYVTGFESVAGESSNIWVRKYSGF